MVVSNISFIFNPIWGRFPFWLIFFTMGWNHEPTSWLTGWCWERSPHDLQLLPNKPTAAGNTQRLMTRKTGRLAEHFCRQMNACWVAEELCVQIWFWDDPIISIVGAIQIDQFPTSFSWTVYILSCHVFYILFVDVFRDDSDVSVFLRDDPNKCSGYLPRFQGLGPTRRPVTA